MANCDIITLHHHRFVVVFCFSTFILVGFIQALQMQQNSTGSIKPSTLHSSTPLTSLTGAQSTTGHSVVTKRHLSTVHSTTVAGVGNLVLIGGLFAVSIIIMAVCLYCFWPDQSPTSSAVPKANNEKTWRELNSKQPRMPNWPKGAIPSPVKGSIKQDTKTTLTNFDSCMVEADINLLAPAAAPKANVSIHMEPPETTQFKVNSVDPKAVPILAGEDLTRNSLPLKSNLANLDVKKSTPEFSIKPINSIKSKPEKELKVFTSLYENMDDAFSSQGSKLAKESVQTSVNKAPNGKSSTLDFKVEPKKEPAKRNPVLAKSSLKMTNDETKLTQATDGFAAVNLNSAQNEAIGKQVVPKLAEVVQSQIISKPAQNNVSSVKFGPAPAMSQVETAPKSQSGDQKVLPKVNLPDSLALSEMGSSSIMSAASGSKLSSKSQHL